ncbi:MAG: hypothetical protein FWG84_10205, partial [Bacteroidales bacterium]|nr:hypothetical protein [Bacteroidales bacterium]
MKNVYTTNNSLASQIANRKSHIPPFGGAWGGFLLLLFLTLSSCDFIHFDKGVKPEAPYAARVYDKYLYLSELQSQLPSGMSAEDSVYWTRNYINLWVQEQLFL